MWLRVTGRGGDDRADLLGDLSHGCDVRDAPCGVRGRLDPDQPGQERMPSECRNVERLQGGLVVKAHRLFYHSTLGLRVIEKPSDC